MPLDPNAISFEDQAPQATPAGRGLDPRLVTSVSEPTSTPRVGLDPLLIQPNLDLDTEDQITPKIYARNVMKSLASGIEPVSRFFVSGAKGATATTGRVLGGIGTVAENVPGVDILRYVPGMQFFDPKLKSLGANIARLGELEDTEEGSWLTEQFPHALGSAVPYVLTGATGGVSAATGLGVMDMGQALYDDAKAHGASENDAKLSFLAGAAIGSAEALPVGYLLKHVNKLSGGSFYEIAKNLTGPGVLKNAVKGFLVGGGTETGQEFLSNWVARDLVGYDPTRSLGENLKDSFLTGGAVGSLLVGGMGALQKAARKEALRELEKEFESKKEAGGAINFISGRFTPILDLPKLGEEAQETEAELLAKGEEAFRADLAGETPEIPDSFVARKEQIPFSSPDYGNVPPEENPFFTTIAPRWVDPVVEKGIVPKDSTMTVGEALQKTPVVVMKIDPYQEQLQLYQETLEKAKQTKNPPPGRATMIEQLEKKIAELNHKTKLTKIWARHMKDYAASFREVLGGDSLILINDFTGFEDQWAPRRVGGTQRGNIVYFRNAVEVNGERKSVYMINIDFDRLATARYKEEMDRRPWYSSEETRAYRRGFFETLNHELGHLFVTREIRTLLDKAAKGDKDARNMYLAIEADYRRWLDKMRKSQLYHYLENVGTPQQDNLDTLPEVRTKYPSDLSKETRDYLFSFDEYFAQQMARLATQGKLAGEGILTKFFKPLLKQYEEIFARMPELAKNEYAQNFEKFVRLQSLHHQISEELQKAIAGGPKSIFDALKRLPGFNPEMFEGLQDHLDKWNAVMDYGENLLQIQKQNPHIQGLRKYVDIVRAWAAYTRAVDARATETLGRWRKLGKKKRNAVAEVLYEETENKKLLSPEELQKRLPDLDQQEVYATIREDFNWILGEMEQASIEQAKKNFPDNDEMRNNAIKEITEEFDKMRKSGYFPYMRFGKWTLTVRDKESKEILSFEAFESKFERDRAEARLKKQFPNTLISPSVMRESNFVVQGLPAAMLRTMKERIPNLSEEQKNAIDDLLQDVAPFRGLRRQFLRRKGVAGFSLDAMRSYAQYMRMGAGHLSRVKYADEFMDSIAKVEEDAKILSYLGRDATKRQQIANWMKLHNDYIMSPESEWTGLRSAIFQWFLGYNIKSAVINLTQVPMISYPYLAARYGDVRAARELATASVAAVSYWKKRKLWTDADPESSRGRIVKLLEQGKKDGWLDQALATELAIAASEGTADRSLAGGVGKRAWFKMSEWGAKPFAVAEKLNRTITAIATYNLEYARTKDHRTAYNAARDAVDSTQYENARWNRPRFMRGKLGTVFVFHNYLQNTLFFMLGGDKGGARALGMLFAMTGVLGMPFAQNAEDLINAFGTKLKEMLGIKDPKFDLRAEMREALEELHMNPDLVLHGLSRSSFGLGFLGQATGIPIPEFDLSGSLGLGRPLPLTSMFGDRRPGGSEAVVGQAVVEAGGAGAAAFDDFLRGIWSNDPDTWKRTEKMLPVFMKSASQAARLAVRGEEKTMRGDIVAEFDPYDPKDFIELTGKAFGFTPTKLSEGWERVIAAREGVNYYNMRREALLKAHNWAFLQEDEEALRDARQKIKEYNDVVPWPELGIGPDSIRNSLNSYIEGQKKAEMGIEAQKRNQRLRQRIEAAYGSSAPP